MTIDKLKDEIKKVSDELKDENLSADEKWQKEHHKEKLEKKLKEDEKLKTN